jgi:hypothetical protein
MPLESAIYMVLVTCVAPIVMFFVLLWQGRDFQKRLEERKRSQKQKWGAGTGPHAN